MNPRKPLRLGLYLRVSSKGQEREKTIEQQRDALKTLCKRDLLTPTGGYILVPRQPGKTVDDPEAWFVDEPFNMESWNEKTAHFDLLMRCARGHVDAILVFDSDRIVRSTDGEIRAKIVKLLGVNETKVITPGGEIEIGGLFGEIAGSIAAHGKRLLADRGQRGKIARARTEGRPPCGKSFFGVQWNSKKRTWKEVEAEALIVRWSADAIAGIASDSMPLTFRMALRKHKNGLSHQQVSMALNDAGYNLLDYFDRTNQQKVAAKNPTGKFSANFIARLFTDDRYIGNYIVWIKDPKFVGVKEKMPKEMKNRIVIEVPAILSEEQLQLARKMTSLRQNKSRRNTRKDYLLQGLLCCAQCGSRMIGRWGTTEKINRSGEKKKYYGYYYTCPRKARVTREPCTAKRCHNKDALDETVWSQIHHLILEPERIRSIEESQDRFESVSPLERLRQEREEALAQIQSRETQIFKVDQRVIEGKMDPQRADAQLQRIEKEKAQYSAQLSALEREIEAQKQLEVQRGSIDFNSLTKRYAKRLEFLSFEERKEILGLLSHRIELDPSGRFRIKLRPFLKNDAKMRRLAEK